MYKKLLKKFSDANPERFNKDFILSRTDETALPEITDIFKSLEVIDGLKIENITMNTKEETFGPILENDGCYKSPLDSRLTKIHYKVSFNEKDLVEKDMYLPKMLNNCFYINEGVRFYPIWQVVDNFSYPTANGVSAKSILMPVTIIALDPFSYTPEFGKCAVDKIPNYIVLNFRKRISPLYYVMMKNSLALLEEAGLSPYIDIEQFKTFKTDKLFDIFNEFYKVDIKFNDDPLALVEDGRTVFTLKEKKQKGLSFSIPDNQIETTEGKIALGALLSTLDKERRKRIVFTYDDFRTPWYWLDMILNAAEFSRAVDVCKRFEKIKSVNVSMDRIIDEKTRSVLPIDKEARKDVLSVIYYVMYNFKELYSEDPHDLHKKRIRLYEYIFYPLRVYFASHINRIMNLQTTVDKVDIEKIFSSLTPMFLMKSLVTSKLLRTYNSVNDYNLFAAYLKGTFKGPQALGKGVSFEQRNIHQSYVGRIDLVAASPGDPGVTFTLSPFVHIYDGYFDLNEADKAKS